MLIIVKCWKTKNGKVCKALCYGDKNGREQIATFDKWFIGALLGSMSAYYKLSVGDEICFCVEESYELNFIGKVDK